MRWLLIPLLLLCDTATASDLDVEVEPSATAGYRRHGRQDDDAEQALPLGTFMRAAPPRWLAASVSETWVPSSGGVRLLFTRANLDIPFHSDHGGHRGFAVGGNAVVTLVQQTNLGQGTHTGGIGNLSANLWFTWGISRANYRLIHGLFIGGVLPVGRISGAPTNSMLHYPSESLPAIGESQGYAFHYKAERLQIDVNLAAILLSGQLAFVMLEGSVTAAVSLWLRDDLYLTLAGAAVSPIARNPWHTSSVVPGLRWLFAEGFEAGFGLGIPVASRYAASNTFPIEPVIELRYITP